jgi:hypothetical protein
VPLGMPKRRIDERSARQVVDQDHGRDRQSPERIDGYQALFCHLDFFLRMKAAGLTGYIDFNK